MNIKDLKEMIKDLPDEMQVVVPGSDHSYYKGSAGVAQAEIMYGKNGKHIQDMWEYYDEGNRSYKTTKIENVFVVGAG